MAASIKNEWVGIKNIGPTIAKRLNSIGISNLPELKCIGAATVYNMLREKYPGITLPVCYYLYSLEGAIHNTHWDDLPEKRKQELLLQVKKIV